MQITSDNCHPTPIVAIGASAGGLEALEQFFSQVPADSGLAFVVIQHLAPQHASLLAELLGRSTRLPVSEVQDGARAEPDHVYVITPGTMLAIARGRFHVRPTDGERREPVDAFFKALASDQGIFAIGIILSGSGGDGTSGLRAIREAGGLTLAQAPETASHDAMPRSAIAAGVVQHVLPIRAMPAKLLEYAKAVAEGRIAAAPAVVAPLVAPPVVAPPSEQEPSDQELMLHLERINAILRRATGHDFSHYKRGMVLRRLRRRVQMRHAPSLDAYLELLADDPREAESLGKDLLIGVTQFFRDPEAFAYLERRVLPQIFAAKQGGEGVRIWVPGCASGEEACSIGILVREQLDQVQGAHPVKIFATDIDAKAIAEARAGRYPADIVDAVSPTRIARFFTRDGSSYCIAREIREMCIFSEHSLIRDPPFLNIDLISCRNVLIYLDTDLQGRLVPVFHYALRPGGFLFLGASEGLTGHAELFEAVEKRLRVFRRLESVTRPLIDLPLMSRPAPGATQPASVAAPRAPTDEHAVRSAFERLMLQEYVPPAAVVTERGDVVCVAGRAGPYLQPPAGVLTMKIFDVVHASLRIELRTALHASARSGRRVVRDVRVEVDGAPHQLRLTIRPLPGVKGDLFAVMLQGRALAAPTGHSHEPSPAAGRKPQVERLESELRTTRNQLRSTIEELEATNEELRSSNEEMRSTNEEMQASNEELQGSQEELRSLNEELATVNSELARKLDELGRANSDLQNLFGSTDIATLFLDRDLRVTRFTPMAKALFRLIETDIGRPLSDLAPRFAGLDLGADVADVLRTLRPVERHVETVDRQAWYLLRVCPYYTVDHAVAGGVITLTDITQVKRAEAERERLIGELREARDQLTADLDATNRLLKIGALFLHEGNLESVLGEIVEAAIAISSADFGNIQVLDRASGDLKIAASRGFPEWWLQYWDTVHSGQGTCGTALERRQRVLVEDVERDPIFLGTPALEIQRRVGVRAVQSTPLLSLGGQPIGILSTHYRAPGTPAPHALRLLDLVALLVANILERASAEPARKDSEERCRGNGEERPTA